MLIGLAYERFKQIRFSNLLSIQIIIDSAYLGACVEAFEAFEAYQSDAPRPVQRECLLSCSNLFHCLNCHLNFI